MAETILYGIDLIKAKFQEAVYDKYDFIREYEDDIENKKKIANFIMTMNLNIRPHLVTVEDDVKTIWEIVRGDGYVFDFFMSIHNNFFFNLTDEEVNELENRLIRTLSMIRTSHSIVMDDDTFHRFVTVEEAKALIESETWLIVVYMFTLITFNIEK